uniref:Uncharacterized protein n=1 Tax=Eiseniibacteriota bacterium TaxID=2212470 RepID=A0A832MLC8_UNCEI
MGFAVLREGEGSVRACPRLLREVCRSGSLVDVDKLDEHVGAERPGEATRRALEPDPCAHTVGELCAARRARVRAPRTFLDEGRRIHRDRPPGHATPRRVVAAFETGSDHSLHGLFSAVASTARDLPDWPERRDPEQFAGRPARLRRPVPSHRGGAALVPA